VLWAWRVPVAAGSFLRRWLLLLAMSAVPAAGASLLATVMARERLTWVL